MEGNGHGRKGCIIKTIETLNATVSSLAATNEQQAEQNLNLQKRIEKLTAQVAWLNRQLFGRKSEKLNPFDPSRLNLFSEQVPENVSEIMKARDKAVESVKETVEDRKRERKNLKIMEDFPYWKGLSSSRKTLI